MTLQNYAVLVEVNGGAWRRFIVMALNSNDALDRVTTHLTQDPSIKSVEKIEVTPLDDIMETYR